MAEQANISPSELRALQLGIAEGVSAMVKVAQTTIVQMLTAGQPRAQIEPFSGFTRAVSDNRETFENQILGLALVEHFAPADPGEEKPQ